jgi:hypothetical protein
MTARTALRTAEPYLLCSAAKTVMPTDTTTRTAYSHRSHRATAAALNAAIPAAGGTPRPTPG